MGKLVPAPVGPVLLNAALLAAEALPRGGVVTLSGDAEGGLVVLPEGQGAAWPAPLLSQLAGDAPEVALEAGPRRVLVPLLLALAAEAGWEVALGLAAGSGGAAAPMPLSPGQA